MDGVTDASFRYMTAKHGGPDVTLTEFVNVQSAFHSTHTLLKDFTYSDIERPIVPQIYGKTPELFYRVAHVVCELGFDGLDINMGCPARKVAATGCGAALTRVPQLAREIIRAVKRGIQDWYEGQTLNDAGLGNDVIEEIKLAKRRRAGHDAHAQDDAAGNQQQQIGKIATLEEPRRQCMALEVIDCKQRLAMGKRDALGQCQANNDAAKHQVVMVLQRRPRQVIALESDQVNRQGARIGRLSIRFASSSPTNRSCTGSHLSGRRRRIEMLPM